VRHALLVQAFVLLARSLARSDACGDVLAASVTLRTYCTAAASISSEVAGGSRPRIAVMLRHMPRRYAGQAASKRSRWTLEV